MNNDEMNKLRTHIEARIDALQAQQESIQPTAAAHIEAIMDEATRLDTLASLSVDTALREKLQRELTALTQQLTRLDNDNIDECLQCGDEIPLARLLMGPTARLCIDCAERSEQR